jgi:hypothetical protein
MGARDEEILAMGEKTLRLVQRLLATLLLPAAICGCGGGSDQFGTGDPPDPPEVEAIEGRFVGTVEIDGENYFGDAIVTDNGLIDLYVGGRYSDDGTIQLASADGSIHFTSILGGRVIGRRPGDCGAAGSPSERWCGRAASASIDIERVTGGASDAIQGEISVDGETWTLILTAWTEPYEQPARLQDLAGQYTEAVAVFARNGNVVLTIDGNGQAFFQSPWSCTGNGTFAPHGSGDVNVFDVTMSIDLCMFPDSSLLNGDYQGLATLSPSRIGGTDSNLRVWLRKSSPSHAAVTMWSLRIPGGS